MLARGKPRGHDDTRHQPALPAMQRGEEPDLSDEKIAFHGARVRNESAVQVMGDDQIKVIAHELLMSL